MRAMMLLGASLFIGLNFANAQTTQPAVPVDRQLPDYPEAAAGTAEGYVKLHFTIAKDGHVIDPSVIESNPPGIFDAAAIAGLKQWTYRPRLVDGHAADQPDNMIVVRFKPPPNTGPAWLNPEPPMYPRQALDAKIEGRVRVGFDITDMGTTTNAHILESTAPGVFDAAAIEDISQRIYQPAAVDGHAPGMAGQIATIEYKLTNAVVRPKPTHIVKPEYPSEANMRGIIGFCAMDVTIAADGSVSNAEVEATFPRRVFAKNCMSAMKRWKFETTETLDAPVAQHLKYMINFRFREDSEASVHYLKPGQWILLDYTLKADGHPTDIKVADQSGPDLPVGKAVEQLKNTALAPFVENGVAVEKQHLRLRVE